MTRHLVIPDTQCKPGESYEHLRWAARYAVATKPDVIIHLGDHWDMPSLSSYDVGKKSFEGRRYAADIEAGNKAMTAFMKVIRDEQKRLRKHKKRIWKPRFVFTLGNHENRIERAVENDAKLEGLMSYEDLNLKSGKFIRFFSQLLLMVLLIAITLLAGSWVGQSAMQSFYSKRNICQPLWDTCKTETLPSTETHQERE